MVIDLDDRLRIVVAQRRDHVVVEHMCIAMEAGWRMRREPMTQVSARYERYRSPDTLNRAFYAFAEAKMIFVRQKAVAERDHSPLPTVSQQKVERDGRAVIEIAIGQSGDA